MSATSILFFGRLSDIFGRETMVDLPEEGCTIAQLKARLAATEPAFADQLSGATVRAAIDQRMVGDEVRVSPGQEIAFFSPLSGG